MTVIALAGSTTQNSGAADPLGLSADTNRQAAPEKCPGVQKALRFYTKQLQHWTSLRTGASGKSLSGARGCPRYLLSIRKAKAQAAQAAYHRWYEHEYHWWKWLPAKFQRVGRCETGGTAGASAAGNWSWDSGTYVSAFGIIRAAFPTWNGHNTPREQYEVAAAIQSRYGWSAWGCGGA